MKGRSKIIVESIAISNLKEGMILAEDIRHDPTGVILVPKGNVITEKALKAIKLFPAGERCLVYSKEIKGLAGKPNPEKKTINEKRTEDKKSKEKEIANLPQRTS